ncbi:MAG TPA: type I pantothenate kinase [Parachlamydiaceae bacterium]|nr:type I pantothenate kinase [Parachlamydiaceae bacterium]
MTKRSPYLEFTSESWSHFRKGIPLILTKNEISNLRGQTEKISIKEVEAIYLPLARLLNMYVSATKTLFDVTEDFFGQTQPKVPFLIGIAGGVAVGKSTTSRVLKALLSRWPEHRRVDIVTTDGFLFPNRYLEEHNLLERKGFPESYDLKCLINFLSDLKAGKKQLKVPVYSHQTYDILPDTYQTIENPDIVILEGLNVLQAGPSNPAKINQLFVSDFFDFSIYVDAETSIVKKWFLDRFKLFRSRAKGDPSSFYHQFSLWSPRKAHIFATKVWDEINARNLKENILPYKHRARLILVKSTNHKIEKIFLRKL